MQRVPGEIVAKGAETEPYNFYDLGAFGCPGDDGTLTFEFELFNHSTQEMSAGAVAESAIRHPINQWYYVVGSYDGINARLWVNGVLEATGNDPGVVVTTHDPLFLNNHTFQGGQSNGGWKGSSMRCGSPTLTAARQRYQRAAPHMAPTAIPWRSGGLTKVRAPPSPTMRRVSITTVPCKGLRAPSPGPSAPLLVLGQQNSGQWITYPTPAAWTGSHQTTVEAWIFPTDQIGGPHDLVAKGPHTGGNPGQAQFEYELSSVRPPAGDPPGLRFSFFVGPPPGAISRPIPR